LKIISVEFVTSAAAGGSTAGIPRDGLPQLAVTGRSNVGKSTLLNALCRSKVARTSAAPGKTRLANVFRLTVEGGGPGKWGLYLVDLPGYGYARGGADAAEELREVAEAYFRGAPTVESRSATFGARGFSPGPEPGTTDSGARPTASGEASASLAEARGLPVGERSRTPRAPSVGDRIVAALLLVDSRHPGLESDSQAAHWLSAMQVDYRVVATKIDKLSRSERARNLKAFELTLGMPALPVSAASGEGMDTLWKTIASLARTGRA
jgi:GTP-binding protein